MSGATPSCSSTRDATSSFWVGPIVYPSEAGRSCCFTKPLIPALPNGSSAGSFLSIPSLSLIHILLYILYKLAVLHGAGDSGVSDAVFYLVCAAIAAAELGIGYSVFRSAAKLRRPKD